MSGESFPPEVSRKLKTYVYRLIDPRNGETFYVGKGRGNRVFAHVRAEEGLVGDELDNKLRRIREIRIAGFQPAHVIHRHGAQHMAKGQLGQVLVTAVGVAGSDGQHSGRSNQAVAAMVNSMLQLKYGRGDESQSDQFGLEAMTSAGYDPSQMLGVMKILSEVSKGNRQPEWLSSHPFPQHRSAQIEAWLNKQFPDGVPGTLTVGRKFKSRER